MNLGGVPKHLQMPTHLIPLSPAVVDFGASHEIGEVSVLPVTAGRQCPMSLLYAQGHQVLGGEAKSLPLKVPTWAPREHESFVSLHPKSFFFFYSP